MEPIRKLYAGGLAGESIVATNVALAGGTATHMARAAFAGVLAGWLYAIYSNAPLLPSLVLGALVGTIGGYLIAERAARQPDGPGAVHLLLAQSDDQLFTVRRYPTFRRTPLRSYPKHQITSVERLPVGMYYLLTIKTSETSALDLIVDGPIDVWRP